MDLSVFTSLSIASILLWFLVLSVAVQLWFYLFYFSRLTYYKKKEITGSTPPVSIVICARNEEQNLKEYLEFVLKQKYSEYQVVVVNDCSSDNTEDFLFEMEAKYPHLKVVTMKEGQMREHGKKLALMMGIKGSTHEYLLLTDADCKPNSEFWLRDMAKYFVEKNEIILGYGAYEKQSGLLNRLIRFDTFMIALQYLSFALANKSYMGIGRNLAYRKELFFKMKGFASHMHINSGDDDLFVNEASTKTNTTISIETHTTSKVINTFREWSTQKLRHISTFSQYDSWTKYRLRLLTGSLILFYSSLTVLLIFQIHPLIVGAIFGTRFFIQLLAFIRPMIMLKEIDLIFVFPVIEPLLLISYALISISNKFSYKHKRR